MMWCLLLFLLASATSGEVNTKARPRTLEALANDLQLNMERVLECLLSNETEDIPSPLGIMADQIKFITTALKSSSSAGDLEKVQDEIQEMYGFLTTEFQQVYHDLEPVGTLNGTTGQLCEPLEQDTCMSHQLCILGRMLQETSLQLEKFITNMQMTHATPLRLTKQQYNVVSGPHAYILNARSHSESHHCILEMEGWGWEDAGFSFNKPFIKINGRPLGLPPRRGVLIISLKFKNQECIVSTAHSYDTCDTDSDANALDVMLKSLPYGTGIAAVTNDEFTSLFHKPGETLMKQYGIHLNYVRDINSMWFRSSAAWFGVKGNPTQARVKQHSRRHGPAKLIVDSMDVKFSPWGKGFLRYPGRMFVGDQYTMVTAATGSDQDCITRCAVSHGCKTVNVLSQGGPKQCQMFTARGRYPDTSQRSAGHSTMYKLAYIP